MPSSNKRRQHNYERQTFNQYLQCELARDPYFAALWETTRDIDDTDEFDAILAAFPERDEWKQQQKK